MVCHMDDLDFYGLLEEEAHPHFSSCQGHPHTLARPRPPGGVPLGLLPAYQSGFEGGFRGSSSTSTSNLTGASSICDLEICTVAFLLSGSDYREPTAGRGGFTALTALSL